MQHSVAASPAVDTISGVRRLGIFGPSHSALFEQADVDRGLVDRPQFCPHFHVEIVPPDLVILVSEGANFALRGGLYVQLAERIDGRRTRQQLKEALAKDAEPLQIDTALVRMASKGYIVSAEHGLAEGDAAFWSGMGVSPTLAAARLSRERVDLAVLGEVDPAGLVQALDAFGIGVVGDGEEPSLSIALVDDYLQPELAAFNEARIDDRRPWVPVQSTGLAPLIGPAIRAGQSACWACLAHRIRGNRQVDSYLRQNLGADFSLVRASSTVTAALALELAAVEIAKWLVIGKWAPLDEHVVGYSAAGSTVERHAAMRRPQCPACGDPELHRPDRRPTPVALRSQPSTVFTSGGMRTVAPRETANRYRKLVSSVTGVINQLIRTSDDNDPWLHVYTSGQNFAIQANSLFLLRTSLRSASSGKGASRDQAEASAICESLERYSGVFHGDEIRTTRRFVDFADGDVVHPNDCMLFSGWQIENRRHLNVQHSRFNYVVDPFDEHAELEWSPVWSLTHERFRHLPTEYLYFSYPHPPGAPLMVGPDSNGCAAGNTLEEAIVQGFLELVERDAVAIWWYNRLRVPRVDIDSFNDPYLSQATAFYRKHDRELWVLDVTSDLGVPVFVTISRRLGQSTEDIVYSPGAHFDPRIALLRSICEHNQFSPAVLDAENGMGYLYDDPELVWWWQNAKVAAEQYLMPAPDQPVKTLADYELPTRTDLLDDVLYCRHLVESRGMELLVLDQTRPDIELPVAKVLVPGIRHFWRRTAPGRLYDVPVQMGRLDRPLPESELNPIPIVI